MSGPLQPGDLPGELAADGGTTAAAAAPAPMPQPPLPHADGPAAHAADLRGAEPRLGMLEALDRNNLIVARLTVNRWPVTVGRALDCDLVLDDPHVAPHHLRLDRAAQGGDVSAQVLDSRNGVHLGLHRHASGAQFNWTARQDLRLGLLKLNLRLADTPLAPEQALPTFPWGRTGGTALLVVALAVWQMVLLWYGSADTEKFAQGVPLRLGGLLGVLLVWSLLWALATKIFTGQAHFWRHVRIFSAVVLLDGVVNGLVHLLAFMFSLEWLARLDLVVSAVVVSLGLYRQLTVVSPHHQRGMRIAMTTLFLLAMAGLLGNNWLQTKRLLSQRQLSSLFPPSWRVAPAVPVPQFINESKALKQRLDQRLRENQSGDGPDDNANDD